MPQFSSEILWLFAIGISTIVIIIGIIDRFSKRKIDTELKDFHLNSESPLIDAGNTIQYTIQSIDGIPRGSTPDIGTYEFN